MGCCGEKRAAARSVASAIRQPFAVPQPQPAAAHRAGTPAPLQPGMAVVNLRYRERSRIRVQGPASGRWYEFSDDQAVQPVEPRDAAALLGTGFFDPVF